MRTDLHNPFILVKRKDLQIIDETHLIHLCVPWWIWFDITIFIYLLFLIYFQAVKDDVGTMRIQRPHKGPFYVTPKSIDQLIANLGKWARLCFCVYIPACSIFSPFLQYFEHRVLLNRWYKYASMGLTVFGFYLIAKRTFQYFMERRRRCELQRRYVALVFIIAIGKRNETSSVWSID